MLDIVMNKIADITGYSKEELFENETFTVNGIDEDGLLKLITHLEDVYSIDLTCNFDPGDVDAMTIEEFTNIVAKTVMEDTIPW